jgi:hypothetical protein
VARAVVAVVAGVAATVANYRRAAAGRALTGPAATRRLAGEKAICFGVTERTEEWTTGGGSTRLTFWDRPLHAMTDAFTAAGFRIEVISAPPAVPGAPQMFPEEFATLSDTRFPGFLFFVLRAA